LVSPPLSSRHAGGRAIVARVPATGSRSIGKWSQATIAIQVALSLLLLVEAGLFARSLSALRGIDTGVANGDDVLLAYARPVDGRPEVASIANLATQSSEDSGILDARSATFSMDTPLGGISMSKGISVPGAPPRDANETVAFNFVGPHFFETMGIAVEGRDIRSEDNEGAPAVAVISRSLANKYFRDVNARSQAECCRRACYSEWQVPIRPRTWPPSPLCCWPPRVPRGVPRDA
jgi:hypothetical protein